MERRPADAPASQRERRPSHERREQRPAPYVEADLLSVDSIGVCSLNSGDGRSDEEDQESEATAVEKHQTKPSEHQGSIEPASGTTQMSTVPIVGSLEELQEKGRKYAATAERKPAGTTAGTGTGACADAREEKQSNMMQTPAHWEQAQAQLREDSAAEEQARAIKSAYDSANAAAKQRMDAEKEGQSFQPAEFPAPTPPTLHETGAPQDTNAAVQPNQQGAEFPGAHRNEETTSMGTLDSIGKRSVRWSMDEYFEIAPLSPMSSIATSVESPLNQTQGPPIPDPVAPVTPPPFWAPSVQEESNSMTTTTTSCSSSSSQGSWRGGRGGPRAGAPSNPYSPYPALQAPREAPFLPWTQQILPQSSVNTWRSPNAPACPLGPVATRRRGPPHATAAAERKLGRSNTIFLHVLGADPPEPPPPPPPRFCPWTPDVKNVGLVMVRGDDPPEAPEWTPAWSESSVVLPPPEPTPLPKKCRCRRRAKKERQKEVKKKRPKKRKQDQPKRKASELGREPRLRIRCHPRPEWVF